jgi:phosphoenolpyruvate-protein kinase (PTS system EI component)
VGEKLPGQQGGVVLPCTQGRQVNAEDVESIVEILFDGFPIGSNDLSQLASGVHRSAADLAYLFDERNAAVKHMIHSLIQAAHASGRKVGICGQGPSDYPEFAAFLVETGIDSISLNPDSVMTVKRHVALAERSHRVPAWSWDSLQCSRADAERVVDVALTSERPLMTLPRSGTPEQ